ncbi:hypothetical protein J2S43_005963 [Catenuloplanes nepalensis]|uniref:Uncharacterized protein n=1 Tax=Catenuloplanes nepalensis TaxID=587533 RepID=A0ABT9N2F2_9ACTN|nr:hypothetical protein [Catenuloplanes nepalensis]MDP9797451.1 hypothetical protein [Catenuloplanes nepalensis]
MLRHLIGLATYRTDATDRRGALTEERLPGGRVRYSHPDLPQLFEARRERMIRDGLDATDLAMLDEGTRIALERTMRRMAREQAAASDADSRGQASVSPVTIITNEDDLWSSRFGAAA